ncbi:MAG: OmpA family protein [Salinivirgaceae bacterium]|mgnify:FL=1|jgi:outer membrane protein OmpA-like peptidoglycan-associated protein|nr:OmpA family protein [Bacteroidales bacterium]
MALKPRYLLLLLFFISIRLYSVSQEVITRSWRAGQAFKQAKEHYNLRVYNLAIESLQEAIYRDPEFIDAHFLLAQIYYEIDSANLLVEQLNRALSIDPEYFPPAYINRAEGYIRLGKYDESLEDIIFFEKKYGVEYERFKPYVDLIKSKAEFAVEALKNPVSIDLKSLPSNINTYRDEYWPSFTVDNKQFFYTLKVEMGYNRFNEEIWTCDLTDGIYNDPKPVGYPVNTEFNEGASFVSPDGRYILFTGCNRNDGFGSCDIYMTVLNDGEWLKPKNLGPVVNSRHWESRPVISSDGTQLYFASNRPGGFGKSDIYRCDLKGYDKDGFPVWGKPVNLGPNINTEGDEMSPFIHPDNVTLYFSSNYYPGMGRFDLYKSEFVEGKWTKPVNLGYPINTHGDEIGIFVQADGKTAFIDKEVGDRRQQDIFYFELPEPAQAGMVTYVKGKVIDKETKKALSAVIDMNDFDLPDSILTVTSNSNGEFLIALVAGKKYGLTVDRESYMFYSGHFVVEKKDIEAYEILVELEPIKIGSKTILNNVFYKTDSYELSPVSKTELNKVVRLLKQNPTVKVEISGHTDNVGTEVYNQKLSENRAKSVYQYISEAGISEDRLSFKGYGQKRNIASNADEHGRAKNRRTEIEIVEK